MRENSNRCAAGAFGIDLIRVRGVTAKKTVLGILLSLAIPAGWAQDAVPKQELVEKFYRLPPGFLPDPKQAGGGAEAPTTGQSFLEQSGVPFPPGAFARYFRSANLMVVRNTSENLDLVDFLIGGCGPCSSPNAVVEFVAWECLSPPKTSREPQKTLTLPEIRRLTADKVRVVSQVSVIGRSGGANSVRQTETVPPPGGAALEDEDEAEFRPGEFGTGITVEPVVGPDGMTIDLAYRYHLRVARPGDSNLELDLTGDITLRDGLERIVHVSPLSPEGRHLVVIARISLKDYNGTPLTAPSESNSP
jgi:hypothetical protein